jgi:hypothetical protein
LRYCNGLIWIARVVANYQLHSLSENATLFVEVRNGQTRSGARGMAELSPPTG